MTTNTISPLRQRMIEDMNARKLTTGTQSGHIRGCRRFTAFLKGSPDTAGAEDIRRFQLHLAQSDVSISSRNRTMTGLRFLFRVTLRRLDLAAEIYHLREPQKIPLVISTDEAKRLLAVAKTLKFACCSAWPMAAACAPARWSGYGSATSTPRNTSFASSRPRAARTATSITLAARVPPHHQVVKPLCSPWRSRLGCRRQCGPRRRPLPNIPAGKPWDRRSRSTAVLFWL